MAAKGFIKVDEKNCKGCQVCELACPTNIKAIGFNDKPNEKGYNFAIQINDKCIGCASCALVCPDSCITVYRAKK